jgi:hypothetical protein
MITQGTDGLSRGVWTNGFNTCFKSFVVEVFLPALPSLSHDDFRGDTVVVHTTARMIEITHFARSNIQYGLYYSM